MSARSGPPHLWRPVAAYMVFIFALSSTSGTPVIPGNVDKGLHALLYAGLAALVVRALAGGWGARITMATVLAATAICGVYGITDELHQHFVPLREADAMDIAADVAGAGITALLLYAWDIIRGRHGL